MRKWPPQGFSVTTSRTELHSQAGVLLFEDTHSGFEAQVHCSANLDTEVVHVLLEGQGSGFMEGQGSGFRAWGLFLTNQKLTCTTGRDELKANNIHVFDDVA